MKITRSVVYSLFALLLASCLQPHVNRSRGVGTVFHSIADDKFYVVYKDTVINDTICELVRPYRCAVFDSLCDVMSEYIRFYEEHIDSVEMAYQSGDIDTYMSLDKQVHAATFADNKAYGLLLKHLDTCRRCKRIYNTSERARRCLYRT